MATNAGLKSNSERECLRSLFSKQFVPLILLVVFGWIIANKAAELDFAAIFTAIGDITPTHWVIAVLAACVSFHAIGRMDVVVHRLMGTGTPEHISQLSGIASVATAQMTGFGLLTGTLARWRVLPDTGLLQAAQITGVVSASFMLALGAISAVMVLIVGPDIPFARPVAAAGLAFIALLAIASIRKPNSSLPMRLPDSKAQASLLGLALIDTAMAAFALYVLIPEAYMPPPDLFYTAFLLALGAGLLGTTPGGVGPFEMMLLFVFADMPQAPILAAIMGYRLVYFALPALLATVLLVAGPSLLSLHGARRRQTPQLNRVRANSG